MTTLRIGLNGAGRIGRALLRLLADREDAEIVAINDTAGPGTVAHLLRHDSVHGPFPGPVEAGKDRITVRGREIRFHAEPDPGSIPWDEDRVELVIEATGKFAAGSAARRHLGGPVRRVVVTAVAPEADAMVVPGVTPAVPGPDASMICLGSCTTHAAALPLALLDRWYGIEAAEMTTVHCTTGSQVTMDQPHRDPRRARSALLSMIPTTTSASRGLVTVLPALAGRLTCLAIRVPVAAGSLVEIVAATRERVDPPGGLADRFRAAAEGELAGLLGVSDEPLVSIDFVGNPCSSVVDLPLLARPGERLVRVIAWYDNEWGYANRVRDVVLAHRDDTAWKGVAP